jgi:drug/metabolite transporter (DMT)-like permease
VNALEAPLWQLMVGSPLMLVVSLPTLMQTRLEPLPLLSVLFLGVAASGFGYVIFYYLLNTIGGTRTSTVTFLLPVTAVVWGVLILKETVSLPMLVGMIVILSGVFLTSRRARSAKPKPAREPIVELDARD